MGEVDDSVSQAAGAAQAFINQNSPSGSLTSMQPMMPPMPPPIPRFQPPEVQYGKAGNEFQTVGGRKRADKEALFHGVAGLIKNGVDYVQAKKQRALTMDLTTLMNAYQGRNEAQQNGDQKAVEWNTAIINELTKDPKKSKLFAKAMNIDIFGGGKNQKENQAWIEASKQFNDAQAKDDKSALNPMAQRIMQSQPMRQQMTPEAIAQLQAIKGGLSPSANVQLQTQAKLLDAYIKSKDAGERTKAVEDMVKVRGDAIVSGDKRTQAMLDIQASRILDNQARAVLKDKTERYVANKRSSDWDKRIGQQSKALQANTYIKGLTAHGNLLRNQLKDLEIDDQKAQAELDKIAGKYGMFTTNAIAVKDKKRVEDQIRNNAIRRRSLSDNLDQLSQQMDMVSPIKDDLTQGGDGSEATPINVLDEPENEPEP